MTLIPFDPDPLHVRAEDLVEVRRSERIVPSSSAWLGWAALSIPVAVGSAYATGIAFRTIEAAIVTFAIGMAWSAATPKVLRWVRRRLRG